LLLLLLFENGHAKRNFLSAILCDPSELVLN